MNKTKQIIFISYYVALAIVLDYIKTSIPFLNMPSGGSINIALIPIVLCSFHLGCKQGVLAGLLWWLVSSLLGLNNYYLSLMQYIVDYVIPSAIIGAASVFYSHSKIMEIQLGILFTMFIRTMCVLISGAVFWFDEASNSVPAWIYTCTYNLPYSIATTIMLMIVVPIIIKHTKFFD